MKNRKHPLFIRNLLISLAFLVLALGILLLIYSTLAARKSIYREQNKHLRDLTSLVDHNAATTISRAREFLSSLVSDPSLALAEKEYTLARQPERLRALLSRSSILETDYAVKILVMRDTEVLFSSDSLSDSDYLVTTYDRIDDILLCVDRSSSANYFGFCRTGDAGLTYVILTDLEDFYRRIVVNSIYSDHWTVLYDSKTGLALQNDYETPGYRLISKEDLLDESDGYRVIGTVLENGSSSPEIYDYTREGVRSESRMWVIPDTESENGIFTVAVAVYDSELVSKESFRSVLTLIGSLLVALSISMVLFFLLHTRAREKELAAEILSLEKEKDLAAEIAKNQESLIHHQKLETIGSMTAGVAHEFNNLLAPIMGNSLLILENTPPENESVYDNALDIYNASRRAKDLVSRISRLSRKSSVTQMQRLNAAVLFKGVLSMVSSTIPNNVLQETDISTNAPIFGDESQLGHMFLNLIINALQAMEPNGGILTLSASDDGTSVIFRVSDTGPGIPEEKLPHIFEPFYTTKPAGKGTGLGLPIAQQTVSNHNGTIEASNLPEGGACFTIKIPICAEDIADFD